jgi:hypothetical protein
MKKILLIIVVGVGVVVGILYFINKEEIITPVVVPPATVDVNKAQLCFYGENKTQNGLYDMAWLKMNIAGDKVTGEFRNLPAEKDSKVGTFEGDVGPVDKTMMARTANVWWDSMAEGMQVKEQLRIIFGEGNASAGFGEMVDRGDGVYVYKDATQLTYGMSMTDVACMDLIERASVENYLRENISKLSPVKAVLGGTWYVVSSTVDLSTNSGTVTYEDGHIQETKNFSYTTDGKGEVINLIISKIK